MESVMSMASETLKQAFGLSAPPILNVIATGTTKIDMSNLFNTIARTAGASAEEKPISPFGPTFSGARSGGGGASQHEQPLNLGSSISKYAYDLVQGLYGTTGGMLAQSLDTGIQTFENSKGESLADKVFEAVGAAGKEFVQRQQAAATRDTVPGLWNATERVYKGTPTTQAIADIRRTLSVVYGPKAVKGLTGNPVLDQITQTIRREMRSNYKLKQGRKEYQKLTQELNILEANRMMSFTDREAAKIPVMRKLNVNATDQLSALREMQERYAKTFGDKYNKAYGVPFSYQDYTKRVVEADRKKTLR